MKKSTILHLRFPFSFFLLPVFLFACAVAHVESGYSFFTVFIILHLLLYPASNGYNSFFDRDEQSIGGLKTPPPVTRELYWASLILDAIAIAWGAWLSLEFAGMLLVYGLVSKAYSHPSIRIKRFPYRSWFIAGFFQGYFTFIMSILGLNSMTLMEIPFSYHFAGLLSSILLFGSYPMTQIYQHEEDNKRGDFTLSIRLGILGTFHFTAISFFLAVNLFFVYFSEYWSLELAFLFLLALTPVLIYFIYWYLQVRKDRSFANFENTMRLNLISSSCLSLFFIYLMWSQ